MVFGARLALRAIAAHTAREPRPLHSSVEFRACHCWVLPEEEAHGMSKGRLLQPRLLLNCAETRGPSFIAEGGDVVARVAPGRVVAEPVLCKLCALCMKALRLVCPFCRWHRSSSSLSLCFPLLVFGDCYNILEDILKHMPPWVPRVRGSWSAGASPDSRAMGVLCCVAQAAPRGHNPKVSPNVTLAAAPPTRRPFAPTL